MFNDGLPGEIDDLRDVENVTIQSKVINDEIPTNYGPGHDVLEGGGGDEVLSTKRGNDKLIGGGGEDELERGSRRRRCSRCRRRAGRGELRGRSRTLRASTRSTP